jgi:hypothetical protein
MQTQELHDDEEQEDEDGQDRAEEVLSGLPRPQVAQGE